MRRVFILLDDSNIGHFGPHQVEMRDGRRVLHFSDIDIDVAGREDDLFITESAINANADLLGKIVADLGKPPETKSDASVMNPSLSPSSPETPADPPAA
jgi:hypothetical protein